MNLSRERDKLDAADAQPCWAIELTIYALALAITGACAWLWSY